MSLKRIVICLSFLALLCVLAACGSGSPTASGSNTPVSTKPTSTPVSGQGTPASGTPGAGPIIISTPTPVPGGSQGEQVQLQDRTLIITTVSKVTGADASSVGISITLTVKNTSGKAISNQGTYYQLISSEGDAFGVQSTVTSGFYGSIAAHDTHSGTIVFQVPTGAASKLRMFYRSEIASETVFVALNI